MVDTTGQYVEWRKEHLSFFYTGLDLSQMDLFKVNRGSQLMDEEVVPLIGEIDLNNSQMIEDAVRSSDVLRDQQISSLFCAFIGLFIITLNKRIM